ncbi:hypothetical protein HY407_02020 [Candidatus Gottesmanbacteria bacterium]|nr:hypothetical protein [Candidatus Gottesmanbacteria bacterium]
MSENLDDMEGHKKKSILNEDFGEILKKRYHLSVFNLLVIIASIFVAAFFAGNQFAGVFQLSPRAFFTQVGTQQGGFQVFAPSPTEDPKCPNFCVVPDSCGNSSCIGCSGCLSPTPVPSETPVPTQSEDQCPKFCVVPKSCGNLNCAGCAGCPGGPTKPPTKTPTVKPTSKPGVPTATSAPGSCSKGFDIARCTISGGDCCTDWGVGDGCSRADADAHWSACDAKCGRDEAQWPNKCGGNPAPTIGEGDEGDSCTGECGCTYGGSCVKGSTCGADQVGHGQAGCLGGQTCCSDVGAKGGGGSCKREGDLCDTCTSACDCKTSLGCQGGKCGFASQCNN